MNSPRRGRSNQGAPVLSIVIPVLDEAATIMEQLDALHVSAGDLPVEVIVADNGSTDGTPEVVKTCAPIGLTVRVVDASARRGISHARNTGIRAAACDLVAICDADDVVGPTWIAGMVGALQRWPVVTGPLLVSTINPAEVAMSRGRRAETDAPTFYGLFPYAHGCNQGFRRTVWAHVGGFDETMAGVASEDIEFGLRLFQEGIPVGFEPAAAVNYRYRRGCRALWRQGFSYGFGRTFVAARARARGLRPPRFAGARSWAWLGVHLLDLLAPTRRERWVWVAANRVGHLRGSVRHRLLLL